MRNFRLNLSLDHALMIALLLILIPVLYFSYSAIESKKQETIEVVNRYCSNCHSIPTPSQLPKSAWPNVLDSMEVYFSHPSAYPIYSQRIPSSFNYDKKEFNRIRKYFIENAITEDQVRANNPAPIMGEIPQERIIKLPITVENNSVPLLLSFDETLKKLFLSEMGANGNILKIFNQAYELEQTLKFDEPPIHISTTPDDIFVTLIGGANKDTNTSAVLKLNADKFSKETLVNGLSRATETLIGDFDSDGNLDIFYCGFGENTGTGYVSIFWGTDTKQFTEQRLLNGSGALKVLQRDLNKDGKKDFLVLFAQSLQNIILFESTSKREYKQKIILQRPIGWGFMDFDLIDIDGDGIEEIITASGNNMELRPAPLKTYHGIYIWKDSKNQTYEQVNFFPMYGATQVLAADFNGDSTIDIAATSMVPDWKSTPINTIMILLQNQSKVFTPFTLSENYWQRFTFLSSMKEKDRHQLLLLGANVPFGLPGNPDNNLSTKLKRPNQVLSIDLKGFKAP